MKIDLETKFNVGQTVWMGWYIGEIDVDIVGINVCHDGVELTITYDVNTGGSIHYAIAEHFLSLEAAKIA